MKHEHSADPIPLRPINSSENSVRLVMSVNIFGFRSQGLRGADGRDGLSIRWFPKSIARMFSENSRCSYYFNTLTDGIIKKGGEVVALRNRTGKIEGKVIKNYKGLEKLETGNYALLLQNTLFECKNVDVFAFGSLCCICLSFKIEVEAELETSRFIFANNDTSRAVSVRKDKLEVWAGDQKPALTLQLELMEWNIVFIQFSQWTEFSRDSFAVVNFGKPEGFMTKGSLPTEDSLYIGAKANGDNFAEGLMGSFQLFRRLKDPGEKLPLMSEEIYQGVMESALVRVQNEDRLKKDKI